MLETEQIEYFLKECCENLLAVGAILGIDTFTVDYIPALDDWRKEYEAFSFDNDEVPCFLAVVVVCYQHVWLAPSVVFDGSEDGCRLEHGTFDKFRHGVAACENLYAHYLLQKVFVW